MRARLDAAQHLVARLALQLVAEHRVHALRRVSRLDDQFVEMLADIVERRLLAAPPGRHRGHGQRYAEQALANRRQEAHQRTGGEQSAAQRVGDGDPPGTRRVEEAGHAERRLAAQFEGVAIIVILAAQDDVDALEPLQRLQIHRVAAHRQVLPLDQRVAKVTGEVGVLEIGFVVRPRRQQHDVRLLARIDRGQRGEAVLLVVEEIGEVLHAQVMEHLGEDTRDDEPVFQCIAGARRRLRTVGDGPPAAVRRACQVYRVVVQPDTARWPRAATGPQEAVLAIDQRRRQQPLGEQALFAIEVGEHRVHQCCALGDRGGDFGPLVGCDDQRQRVERPRAIGALGIGIDVVGDAVFLDAPVDEGQALVHLFRRGAVKVLEELLPVRPHLAARAEHFVVAAAALRVDCK